MSRQPIFMTMEQLKGNIKDFKWVTDIENYDENDDNIVVRFLNGNTRDLRKQNLQVISIIK